MGARYTNAKWLAFLTKIGSWLDQLRQNRQVIVFLVFLIIATGFWFLNALRKDYIATLNYPVRFVNVPDDKMLSDDFKENIRIKVQAGGFAILRYQFSNTFLPLNVDVSQLDVASDGEKMGVFVLTSNEQNRIVGQLSQGMELIDISPDTLFIPLIEQSRKRVPVKVEKQLSFEKQYLQAGAIIVRPDTVEISGPVQVIDTIKYIRTRKIEYDNLVDTVNTSVVLQLPASIHASFKRVSVTIPVEPFTELNIRVPVRIQNLPDTLRIKTFPSEIRVSFRVGISEYENINESQFRAVVDVSPVLTEDRPDRLKVRLDRVPKNVESIDFSPIFVEYLLEKRK
jgi:hypothetical protein